MVIKLKKNFYNLCLGTDCKLVRGKERETNLIMATIENK